MLYITGKEETLEQLRIMEGFGGSLLEYQKKFAELNPNLCSVFPGCVAVLPRFVMINLVNEPIVLLDHSKEVAEIVNNFDESERELIRKMQEDKFDLVSLIEANLIVEEFNEYIVKNPPSLPNNAATPSPFQQSLFDWSLGNLDEKDNWLSQPIVSTPFERLNKATTQESFLDWSSRTFNRGVDALEKSPGFQAKNTLFELMKQRLEVNLQHEKFKNGTLKPGKGEVKALVKKAQELTRQIKRLAAEQVALNEAKIIQAKSKEVLGYTLQELKKVRTNVVSIKEAQQGEAAVARLLLERLNKTGLKLFRNFLKGAKAAGTGLGNVVGAVGVVQSVNTVNEVGRQGGNVSCAAASETAGFFANLWMLAAAGGSLMAMGSRFINPSMVSAIGTGVAALGGLLFQSGFIGLGSAILTCVPGIGWVVLGIAGGIALALFTNSVKETTNQGCVAMTEVSKTVAEQITDFATEEYQKLMNFFDNLAMEADRNFNNFIKQNMYPPMGR